MTELESLYRTQYRLFLYRLNRETKKQEVSEDILQEAFLRALSLINSYDPDRGDMKKWFNGIVMSTLWNVRRKEGKHVQCLDIDEVSNSSCLLTKDVPNLSSYLAGVNNPTHRDVIAKRLVSGLSYGEIAHLTGMGYNRIRKIIQRFRRNFKGV